MLPSWIRSSSDMPRPMYFLATETTRRRFASVSRFSAFIPSSCRRRKSASNWPVSSPFGAIRLGRSFGGGIGDGAHDRLQVGKLHVEHVGRIGRAGGPAHALQPRLAQPVDVLALLHLAGEPLLVVGGEQRDLADLAQVHADRVVDPLLVL